MKTILVTGGAGFIGSHLVRHLFRTYPQYRLVVVDALTYAGNLHNLPRRLTRSDRFAFHRGNVRDAGLMDVLVGQVDAVVHLAAETHVTRSLENDRPFFETAVLGTHALARAVRKHRQRVERFLHISTSEVYGTALAPAMHEDHPLNPASPYAAAKCGADRLVHAFWKTHQIPAVIVRPFNNYGPNQHPEKVIPHLVTSCLLGEPLTVHGDGSAARDWLFVADHCEALDRLLHADPALVDGQVFNLGTGRHHSVLEVVRAVQEALHAHHLPVRFLPNRPGQVARHTCDASRARRFLGWIPRTEFAEGIDRTVAWYRRNEAWWRPLVDKRRAEVPPAAPHKKGA